MLSIHRKIAETFGAVILCLVSGPLLAQVFINEIHYDNTGADTGEAIEVAGPAGTNLTGWNLVLYNGSNGAVYNTTPLSGTLANQQNGFGTFSVSISGIQNGAPDGVALVDGTNTVVQFLSYEGSLTATGGPANGMTSTNIGVSESSSTPVGESLQLMGFGTMAGAFAWTASAPETFGLPNAGQDFGGTETAPAVLLTSPANGAAGVAVGAGIEIGFSEDVSVNLSWFGISCTISGSHPASYSGGPRRYTIVPDAPFDASETCTVTVFASEVSDFDANDPPDTMAANFVFSFDTAGATAFGLVINEIDYDQPGTDTAEFVEIYNAGAADISLSGYNLEFVNGSNGEIYQNFALPGVTLAAGDYFVVCGNASQVFACGLDVSPNSNLIQNGAPDAVALTFGGLIVDTVSYEDDVSGYTEGSGAGLVDSSSSSNANKGISRLPNGTDTDQNNVDFQFVCSTPGAANTTNASNCPSIAPPNLVINEVDYDQPGADGAEFVEILNTGQGEADLTGIELLLVNGSNGTPYATIALPTIPLAAGDYFVVCADALTVANCDLDAISSIQNGAPDAVALVLGSAILDTVSYEGSTAAPYTEGTGTSAADSNSASQGFKGLSRAPNGSDTNVNDADFFFVCITPGRANTSLTSDCTALAPVREIYEIQGSGPDSPFAGQSIRTEDNVVTAVGPDQFAMQTPSARTDGDIDTSDGIVVFTGGVPTVTLGDLVTVTGEVIEFFGFTEFSGGSLVEIVTPGGGIVPAAVTLDAFVPSPDPTAPSCSLEFECYEGMLVSIADGTVTGPNQRFGVDPVAEVHITAAPARTFREPGVEFPNVGPLVWDGNPEVFELDPDKLGLPNQIIPAGSSFSATGIIGFEFGGYELWPSGLIVTPALLPAPVRAREPGEFTVGTLNLFRLFDDIDDPADAAGRDDFVVSTAEYARRLTKFSAYIRDVLDAPDILAVQEVEKFDVLVDLANEISADDPAVSYLAYLEEGNDIGTIDVGFLVREDIIVHGITQLGKDETFIDPGDGSVDILHDRPPLLLDASCPLEFGSYPISVMVVHNRSLGGIEGSEAARVRQKRYEQAVSIVDKVEALKLADPDVRLAVIGDFNAFEFTDGYVDAVGIITGEFDPAANLVCDTNDCALVPDTELFDEILDLDQAERYSFVFGGNAQVLDHALTSVDLAVEVSGSEFGRGNADAAVDLINDDGGGDPSNLPLRSSDHDGYVVYVLKDEDADGVPNDEDFCPATVIPENVPTKRLGTNRFALTNEDGVFDTTAPKGKGPGKSFDLQDTAGCSCEQIIEAQGLGNGHTRFGCSISAMDDWVGLVTP